MPTRPIHDALSDVAEAIRKHHLATIFGWQDVAQRYQRSRIGAFWITINMSVLMLTIGVIFGSLFRTPMVDFLPYLCAGLVVWGYLSTVIGEACLTFVSAEGVILQIKIPMFTHIMRLIYRNVIVFLHTAVIIPVVLVLMGHSLSWNMLLAPFGFLLVTANLVWISVFLSVLCARYRDITQVIQNILQMVFYATPIIWKRDVLPEGMVQYLLNFNPAFHLVEIVRAPLLGQLPSELSWIVAVFLLLVGSFCSLLFFGKFKDRVPYWL
ncbi:ABC transporter permease [Rhizobium sp. L51/94]|uniref:ABC transporter permease n=1 Tax=Rhizobium sp. L51/94 TaxID=2819999 RepID=UPI001C5AC433|nr:ABC transporter permease [Rhizobium sp. L51/94]